MGAAAPPENGVNPSSSSGNFPADDKNVNSTNTTATTDSNDPIEDGLPAKRVKLDPSLSDTNDGRQRRKGIAPIKKEYVFLYLPATTTSSLSLTLTI